VCCQHNPTDYYHFLICCFVPCVFCELVVFCFVPLYFCAFCELLFGDGRHYGLRGLLAQGRDDVFAR
jgi:hypothetical protein